MEHERDRPHVDGRTGGRAPLKDSEAEAARTAAYWAWLEEAAADLEDRAPKVADAGRDARWVRLASAEDADDEASRMRHSIGHSWEKYSAFGEIYSLRARHGEPMATVLVSSGEVVHAREHENARLSRRNEALLEEFARSKGWAVSPDPLPFDVLDVGGGI